MEKREELLANLYLDAKEYVIKNGYAWELDWQARLSFNELVESQFLAEAAWVILASGFRESIIRKIFPSISNVFLNWEKASRIVTNIDQCKEEAYNLFKNAKKIDAICSMVRCVSNDGFEQVKQQIRESGIDYLQTYPFIGPVTSMHLLKNLGISIPKPDRHLVRIATAIGFNSVQDLCNAIEQSIGDSIPEIDIVLWRYATLKANYLSDFQFSKSMEQTSVII